MKDHIFISHANPEDNEFSLWLSLQLVSAGYPVWSDITKLLGGEDFWGDIEDMIRNKVIKFLFVLSNNSNNKKGPLNELAVAEKVQKKDMLKDFIIPLRIDNIAFDDINIRLQNINTISFTDSWAQGLKFLLEKLENNEISQKEGYSKDTVAYWWKNEFSKDFILERKPDLYYSNWFEFIDIPQNIYFHELGRERIGKIQITTDINLPYFQYSNYIVSFCNLYHFEEKLHSPYYFKKSLIFSTNEFIENKASVTFLKQHEQRNFIVRLLNIAWNEFIIRENFPVYELSNNNYCMYFPKGRVRNDKISFIGTDNKETWRQIVGYKTTKKIENKEDIKRYWHFGIQSQAMVYPKVGYIIKPHVLFSDDGRSIWDSKKRLHAARRSQCKNWWNADWRDRILAVMSHLSKGNPYISIFLENDNASKLSPNPTIFQSEVSYKAPEGIHSLFDDYELDDKGE